MKQLSQDSLENIPLVQSCEKNMEFSPLVSKKPKEGVCVITH